MGINVPYVLSGGITSKEVRNHYFGGIYRKNAHWLPEAPKHIGQEIVSLLIDAGADVNARTQGGDTALMYAARANLEPDTCLVLLEAGADASDLNRRAESALDQVKKNPKLKNSDIPLELKSAMAQ